MTGTRDLELTHLLVGRETGAGGKGLWGALGSGEDLMVLKGSLERTSLLTKVSHHPPVSACHAESENFIFWQGGWGCTVGWAWGVKDRWGRGWNTLSSNLCCPSPSPTPTPDMKWKNKFWGKSLEIVPVGTVNVSLPR